MCPSSIFTPLTFDFSKIENFPLALEFYNSGFLVMENTNMAIKSSPGVHRRVYRPMYAWKSCVVKHKSVDEKSTWMLVGITTEQSTIRPWHRTSLEMIYLYILCHQANFRHNFRLSWHQFRHLWAMRSFSIDLETFNKISCVFCSHSHVLSNNGEVLVTCV